MPAETATDQNSSGLSRSREREQAIAEIAERQYGVITRDQLLGAGVGEKTIEHRLAIGRLHLLHPATYSVGHRLIPREGRWLAAVLASGPEAVLSHWSAAALWMIRPNSRSAIDITSPRKSRSWAGIRRHHKALPFDEVTAEEGIPVTTVPRTIFDLAATESVDVIKAMLKESEYRNLYDRLSLWDLIERYPAKRGVRKVRAVLERIKEEPAGRKRSRLEERFAPFLHGHRLPLPRFNDWIFAGGKRFQVDCHWPGTRQIVELDGWEGHGTRSAFREDRARDRILSAAGYTVTRITWNPMNRRQSPLTSARSYTSVRDNVHTDGNRYARSQSSRSRRRCRSARPRAARRDGVLPA